MLESIFSILAGHSISRLRTIRMIQKQFVMMRTKTCFCCFRLAARIISETKPATQAISSSMTPTSWPTIVEVEAHFSHPYFPALAKQSPVALSSPEQMAQSFPSQPYLQLESFPPRQASGNKQPNASVWSIPVRQ